MKRIAVIGAGSWGTALAIVAARAHHQVKLWTRSATTADYLNAHHRHPSHLIDIELPENLRATNDIGIALDEAEIVVLAVPSHAMREVATSMREHLTNRSLIVSAAKGIEVETGMRVSQIIEATLAGKADYHFVCLSGPSFAHEVAANQPTAVVAASLEADASATIQESFSHGNFRVYTNDDVVGAELGGAVKNTMALASGMVAGLGLGANSVAALITRGLAEMVRFAVAHRANRETLMGLAGLGDLVLTCTGASSRNRHVGFEMGRGRTLDEVLGEMTEVAEGVRTTRAIKIMADKRGIEMPITTQVDAVLYGGKSVREAIDELMRRPLRNEFDENETATQLKDGDNGHG